MPFLLGAAGISGLTSLLGGVFGSNAASDASAAQVKAEQQALQQWLAIQQQNQGAISPYTSTASTILPQLLAMTQKGFQAPTSVTEQNDPGYQFRLQEGEKAIEQSAAARGGATGGGELKALTDYGQNYASNEYGNVYNRALTGYQTNLGGLQYLSNLGLSATGMGMNSNLGVGQGITQAMTGIGNAQAAGTVGAANAWTGALGGFGNNISQLTMLNGILNKPTGPPAIGNGLDPNGNPMIPPVPYTP